MLPKTLAIRDEVYKRLVSVKEKDGSFSELFERLVEQQSPIELLKSLRGSIKLERRRAQIVTRNKTT